MWSWMWNGFLQRKVGHMVVCADWGKKSIVSWALLKGAVLKYRLVKVNSTVTSLDTSRYHEIWNYSVLLAKFWAFDVGTGTDILLESEGKIEIKMLEDREGEGNWLCFNKKILCPFKMVEISKKWQKQWQGEWNASGEPSHKSDIPVSQTFGYGDLHKWRVEDRMWRDISLLHDGRGQHSSPRLVMYTPSFFPD